jgi:hypothetical protein
VSPAPAPIPKRTPWKIALGVFILVSLGTGASGDQGKGSLAFDLGRITGLLMFAVMGVWLIRSGLKKKAKKGAKGAK